HEHGVLGHPVGVHTALEQIKMQVDVTTHLDRAAKCDLAVPLGEMQITHREVRPADEYRVEHPGPRGEILDVLIATVLPRRGSTCPLSRRPFELVTTQAPHDRVLWFRR